MKVRASVKQICKKCKVIRRQGVVRVPVRRESKRVRFKKQSCLGGRTVCPKLIERIADHVARQVAISTNTGSTDRSE